jgi:hypothetical protein
LSSSVPAFPFSRRLRAIRSPTPSVSSHSPTSAPSPWTTPQKHFKNQPKRPELRSTPMPSPALPHSPVAIRISFRNGATKRGTSRQRQPFRAPSSIKPTTSSSAA